MSAEVGTELPPLTPGPITRTTLALFAGASGDHNPVHIDLDAAVAAGHEDVFAHGMLTMAHVGRLLTGWVPQGQIRSLSGRFEALTPVGAEPIVTGVVTEIDDQGVATVDLSVTLEDGTRTMTGRAIVAPEAGAQP